MEDKNMGNSKPAIVVVTYNRPNSLKRLLDSLAAANYEDNDVPLIISIDKAKDDKGVLKIAEDFKWHHGSKRLIKYESNLGLRKHILNCGDLSSEYKAVIVLEDDLVVSPEFYKYSCQASDYYKDNEKIAQISLFNYEINEYAHNKPFQPLKDDSDVYYVGTPSSWGELWTEKQWSKFRSWYDNKEYENVDYSKILPDVILRWPETSWKKYYAMYMAEKQLFAVYPRAALSTNMSDVGTHYKEQNNFQQVNLMYEFNRNFIFKPLEDSKCKYDSFMESLNIKSFIKEQDIAVDYFGCKNNFVKNRYLLSTEQLPYKIINSWALRMRPYELNIIYNIEGNGIFLYDTEVEDKIKDDCIVNINKIRYENPSMCKKNVFALLKYSVKNKIKNL